MGKLIILSGIPAVGKSTYSMKLRDENSSVAVVSTDAIREELDYHLERERANHKLEKTMWSILIDRVKKYSKTYDTVVIDSTATTNKRRMWYHTQFQKDFDQFELHILTCDIELCIKRNLSRERVVPEKAIHKMNEIFQEPDERVISTYKIIRVNK